MTDNQTMNLLHPVLDELSHLTGRISAEQRTLPTPCSDFDVAALTGHTVGWLENFAAGFASDDGTCPSADVRDVHVAPGDAPGRIRDAAGTLGDAVAAGAAERNLVISNQGGMPGEVALSMILGEYLVHGWDLARATGQPWHPDEKAVRTAHAFLAGMVTPEYRGPGGMFGPEVEVPADAPALDKLVGFAGRDPQWTAGG